MKAKAFVAAAVLGLLAIAPAKAEDFLYILVWQANSPGVAGTTWTPMPPLPPLGGFTSGPTGCAVVAAAINSSSAWNVINISYATAHCVTIS
jgi:hypothetical protein